MKRKHDHVIEIISLFPCYLYLMIHQANDALAMGHQPIPGEVPPNLIDTPTSNIPASNTLPTAPSTPSGS